MTVKALKLGSDVPARLVTVIFPVVAPGGTCTLIEAPVTIVIVVAATPLNLTSVIAERFVPLIATTVPTRPLKGENVVIVGSLITTKLVVLVVVPSAVVTLILPVLAPAGILTTICEYVTESIVAV